MMRNSSLALAAVAALSVMRTFGAEPKRDLVVVGGTTEAVEAAIAAKTAGRSVLLLSPRNYVGEDVAGTMAAVTTEETPLELKRALDRRLIAAGVECRTWAPVTAIDAGGVTVSTRGRSYRVPAGEVRDLRLWRVDPKAPRGGRKVKATRVVVSGERPNPGEGATVEEVAVLNPVNIYRPAKGFPTNYVAKVWRCTMELTMPENTVRGRLAAEQEARRRTWTALELDAADVCLTDADRTLAPCEDMECDVLVVGMGTGGAPAAISAGRTGMRTIVCEWTYRAGGLTTEGLISNYWYGNVCGFTSEIDAGHTKLGPCHYSTKSEWFRREAERADVEMLFGTVVTDVIREGNRIVGAWAVLPTGEKVRIRCKVAIDATGNADLAAAAGEPTEFVNGEELSLQGAAFVVKTLGHSYGNLDWTFIDDTDVDDLCYLSLRGRLSYRKGMWDQSQAIDTRERRRLHGVHYVTPRDVMNHRTYPDVICVTRSNFDTHGQTVDPQFFIDDPPHQPPTWVNLPYRSILPQKTDGLLVIGLGMSAHRDAMPILRMQPDVQNQGYAAGYAAAMAVKANQTVRAIDVKELQRHLIAKGILKEEVLTMQDSYPLPDDAFPKAVASLTNAYDGLSVVMDDATRSLPLLRAAYAAASADAFVIPKAHPHKLNPAPDAIVSSPKLVYAHVLGMMGDASGAKELKEKVAASPWDEGWNYRGMNQLFRSVSWLDSYVIALGRSRAPGGDAVIRAKAAELTPDRRYSHYRAIALALEAYGGAENAACLAKLLKLPGVAGHAFDLKRDGAAPMPRYNDMPSGARVKRSGVPDQERSDCLRELCLARALYRCGDADGLGEKTLRAYAADPRRAYANHAEKVLEGR